MKKLIPFMAIIVGSAFLASAAGDRQHHRWSIFPSPAQGIGKNGGGNYDEPQAGERDTLSFIVKYYHRRMEQSLRSLNDCNAEKAFLLHNAIWQVDSGMVVNLDCSGRLKLRAR